MRGVNTLIVLLLLCACDKSSNKVAAPATEANHAVARDCAAILQNVRAGRDVIVNVHCDVPTEAKLIAALAQGKWKRHCPYVIPAIGWQARASQGQYDLIPSPGSYWGQYGFVLNISPFELSQVDYVYANSLPWENVSKQFPNIDRTAYERIQGISKIYPPQPAAISTEADDLLRGDQSASPRALATAMGKKVIDHMPIRRELIFEDGSELSTLNLAVMRADQHLSVGITLLPGVDAYPTWSAQNDGDPPQGTALSCSANADVDLQTYKTLCTILLERQALAPKVISGEACQSINKAG